MAPNSIRPPVMFAAALVVALVVTPPSLLRSQTPAPHSDDAEVSFRVRLGVADREPRAWDGALTVSNGELLDLRDWHPRPENQIGASNWKLATQPGIHFKWRPWEKTPSAGPKPYLLIPGIIVDVRSSPGTRLNFRTPRGRFSFNPRDVPLGRPAAMLGGAVLVDRVPAVERLSSEDYQDDFVSLLGGAEGEVWVCWVAYREGASRILARRFDGQRWGEAQTVSEAPGDIFLAKMGRDSRGRPWAVWSAQVDGNWDLYGRSLAGAAWSSVLRLTAGPEPDVFPNLAADSAGNLWLVWQGFRGGQADIFARRYDGSKWSEAERVSLSDANDWEPVIATDAKGRAYVAWDTYDQGNYDVVTRQFADGQWSQPVPIADTPKYEAHVTLATDNQNRLWAAWNESGTNWGKDTGYTLNLEGTRLYEGRSIAVAVYDGAGWRVPTADINQSLPADLEGYNDYPQLAPDAAGRMWLFARHRTLRIRDVPSEAPAHRAAWEIWGAAFEGDRWTEPMIFPFSSGRMDLRWGVAPDGKGNLFAAWPSDQRDFDEFLFQHADVYAARLPALPGEAEEPKLAPRKVLEIPAFPLHPNEPEDLARIRGYRIHSGGKTYRIFRGDTHRHSEFSMDGNNEGSLLQTYRYAIDVAQLDYLLASEHNGQGGPDIDYINWLLQQMVDVLSIPNRFRAFYGYERSVPYPNGHRNVLFTQRGKPTLPIPEDELRGESGADSLYAYLKKHGGIAISHTSATGMGTDWRDNDAEVEPLVEIFQGDRVSAEYEGAPRAAHRDNPNSAPGGFRPAGYVWNAWAKGYKLGVQAASDHLSTHISYACTIAQELTPESLLEAMRKRHSYGATDNIILDYRLQAGDREYLQGDIVTVSEPFRLWVKVIGTTPIRQIDIIRNQVFVHNRQNLEREVGFTFTDNDAGSGENYYYVRVIQNDGNIAWSSPIWVTRRRVGVFRPARESRQR